MSRKKIAIAGSGLVGSLLSVYLSKRGHSVDVYERRPDMRKETISAGRSINLALSTRGLHALETVGLKDQVLPEIIPMKGRMVHTLTGELMLQPYGTRETDCINSISRGALNKILMTAAERSPDVKIHFSEKVTHVDLESGVIHRVNEKSGSSLQSGAEVIFGADGSASALRSEIGKLAPGFSCTETPLSHGYKELSMPSAPGGGFKMYKNALHIWPRGTYMLIALPNLDGTFTCTLFLPNEGPLSFESLKTPEKVRAFFNEQFADAVPLIPDLVEQFFANPTGRMVTVKTRPWNYRGRALLIGDAAHAIVPFFGQGMNCGFEDCSILDQYLSRASNDDWTSVFERFTEERPPNSNAIADMAVENFVEMRDKVAQPQFQFQKKVETLLQKEFPKQYVSRYALVTFSLIPYSIAYRAGLAQEEILAELCRGLDKPEDVNLARAKMLIEAKLAPVLKDHIH